MSILAKSAYMPTSGKHDEFLETLWQLSALLSDNKDCMILIGTDSNCSLSSTTRRIESFYNFCADHNLKLRISESTFHHANGIFLQVLTAS